METLNNVEGTPAEKTGIPEVERTITFWKKRLSRFDRKFFDMIVFEHGLQDRDRLTKSQVDMYIDRRKNKKIG